MLNALDCWSAITVICDKARNELGSLFVLGVKNKINISRNLGPVSDLLILGQQPTILDCCIHKGLRNAHKARYANR